MRMMQARRAGMRKFKDHELKVLENIFFESQTSGHIWINLNGRPTISIVERGTGLNERIGNKIVVTEIECRGHTSIDDTTNGEAYLFRFSVVLDTQYSGQTMPVYGDVFQTFDDYSGNYMIGVASLQNRNHENRFQILFDKTYRVSAYTYINTNAPVDNISVYNEVIIECKKKVWIELDFNENNIMSERKRGNIFVCSSTYQNGPVEFLNNVNMSTRIRFYDL